MHPHTDTAGEQPAPGLDVFADAMRSVLRTRTDSPVDGPEALETWDRVGGCVWWWTTDAGQWRVTAGAAADSRPLLHGPGGIWRVDTPVGEAAGLVLLMLRAAGAIPGAAQPAPPRSRQMYAVVGGKLYPAPSPAEPLRAVVHLASEPAPELPAGYVAVQTTSDEPDEHGRWDVLLPDGYHHHTYDPTRRCLVPYGTADGTDLLLFEPDQSPAAVAA